MANRHYCTYCGSKRVQSKMVRFYIPLVHISFWSCKTCFDRYETEKSTAGDFIIRGTEVYVEDTTISNSYMDLSKDSVQ